MPFDGAVPLAPTTLTGRILKVLGENGENWTVGWGENGKMCILHAVTYIVGDYDYDTSAGRLVQPIVKAINELYEDYHTCDPVYTLGIVAGFNDSSRWPAVKEVLERAQQIELQGESDAV